MEPKQDKQWLQQALDYIENHLESWIVLEELSAVAGYSPSHFVWMFRTTTGQTPIEYVRKRRMTEAAKAILAGEDIIDAAQRFGFSAQDTFTRSFKHTIGLPPGKLRVSRGKNGTYTLPPNLQHEGGMVMDDILSDVRQETLKPMRVASCCIISKNPEEQVILYLSNWVKERGVDGTRAFGFDYPAGEELSEQGFRGYEYWIVIPEEINETDGVEIKNIPENEYAVLRITDPFTNPFERIPSGWKKLYEWVLARELCPEASQGMYCLEEVIEDESGNIYMDCYFPIK
ncbi:helix-turn-helix domain-containing protein [Chloroflexota bacterium]